MHGWVVEFNSIVGWKKAVNPKFKFLAKHYIWLCRNDGIEYRIVRK